MDGTAASRGRFRRVFAHGPSGMNHAGWSEPTAATGVITWLWPKVNSAGKLRRAARSYFHAQASLSRKVIGSADRQAAGLNQIADSVSASSRADGLCAAH
jgi:hypothetical protein